MWYSARREPLGRTINFIKQVERSVSLILGNLDHFRNSFIILYQPVITKYRGKSKCDKLEIVIRLITSSRLVPLGDDDTRVGLLNLGLFLFLVFLDFFHQPVHGCVHRLGEFFDCLL